jgi:hypothetical protein
VTRNGSGRLVGIALLTVGLAGAGAAHAAERYVAELHPLNADALGRSASGTAMFDVEDGRLTITVLANGLAPGVMHLQHYHGLPEGKDATCPTPQADTNGDGLIDLVETEPMAGTTMVPFHADPASLEIASDTYPIANEEGTIRYKQAVPVDDLERALADKFGVSGLALEERVVFLHGTAPDTDLPASVQSLPDVPAQVTLPIACGTIERAE